jgi:hypothetical protein
LGSRRTYEPTPSRRRRRLKKRRKDFADFEAETAKELFSDGLSAFITDLRTSPKKRSSSLLRVMLPLNSQPATDIVCPGITTQRGAQLPGLRRAAAWLMGIDRWDDLRWPQLEAQLEPAPALDGPNPRPRGGR